MTIQDIQNQLSHFKPDTKVVIEENRITFEPEKLTMKVQDLYINYLGQDSPLVEKKHVPESYVKKCRDYGKALVLKFI